MRDDHVDQFRGLFSDRWRNSETARKRSIKNVLWKTGDNGDNIE